MAARGPKVATRRLQEAPRRFQDAQRMSKMAPRDPKMAPRASKMASYGPNMPPRFPQEGSIGAKLGAKMVPKMEILDFQKTVFFLVFFNKNDPLGHLVSHMFCDLTHEIHNLKPFVVTYVHIYVDFGQHEQAEVAQDALTGKPSGTKWVKRDPKGAAVFRLLAGQGSWRGVKGGGMIIFNIPKRFNPMDHGVGGLYIYIYI